MQTILQLRIDASEQTLIALVQIFGLFVLLLQLSIMTNRLFLNWRKKTKESLKAKYELLLTGIIFIDEGESPNSWQEERQKLIDHFRKHYMHRDFNRKVLVDELMLLHRTYGAVNAVRIKDLYYSLGLDKTGIKMLRKANASLLANIIRDLAQMDVQNAIPAIRKLKSHPSSFVRLEANIALFKLDNQNLFQILDTKEELSTWEQIKIFEVIRYKRSEELPLFSKWLNSSNLSVVTFCLQLIAHYKQDDARAQVMQMLTHSNLEIRVKAWQVLESLGGFSDLDPWLEKFDAMELEEKEAFMHCVSGSGNKDYFSWFYTLVQKNDAALALMAGKCIFHLGEEALRMFECNVTELDSNAQELRVYKHCNDRRLLMS